jgi:hypothetical protein
MAARDRRWLSDERTVAFRAAVRAARQGGRGVAGIGEALIEHGIRRDWLRDRDFGRAPVTAADLVTLQALLQTAQQIVGRYGAVNYAVKQTAAATATRAARGEVSAMRELVAAFCVQCSDKACYDATCVLRPISPLPLRGSAFVNDPLSSK